MYVLTDEQTEDAARALDAAWSADETFVFVPRHTSAGAEWIANSLQTLPPALQTGHFALLTSGSTGQPKLVVGEKRRSENLARALHLAQDSEPVRQTVVTLPLTYCYAFINQWLWARVEGRDLLLTSGFSHPDDLKRALGDAHDAMLCMVGAQVPLLEQTLAGSVFPGVLRLHFAGGRFPQDKLAALHGFFPKAQVFNNYGCTEAMPRLTLRRAEGSPVAANIGTPLPGIELSIGDGDALLFRSPYGSVGYVDGDGFHAVADVDWTPTGDLAKPAEGGTWELLGRANEVFKRYGEKVSLPALQGALAERWPGQVAFYRETDSTGELGHVLVVAPTPTPDDVREMQRALRAHFTRAHWPLRIESVATLPRLGNGKIDSLGLSQTTEKQVHWRQHI
jgi:acyl-CoA synthetase (AMP-forming)/AMP-acid ligase II